jgi:hypothetical protein
MRHGMSKVSRAVDEPPRRPEPFGFVLTIAARSRFDPDPVLLPFGQPNNFQGGAGWPSRKIVVWQNSGLTLNRSLEECP